MLSEIEIASGPSFLEAARHALPRATVPKGIALEFQMTTQEAKNKEEAIRFWQAP